MNKNKTTQPYFKYQQISGHQGPIYALSQDNSFYYSASADKFVARWHPENGQQDHFAVRCTQAPFSLYAEPTLQHLVIGLSDGHLHVIDTLQKQEVKNLIVHQSAVFAISKWRTCDDVFASLDRQWIDKFRRHNAHFFAGI